jgi:hypothetical protein
MKKTNKILMYQQMRLILGLTMSLMLLNIFGCQEASVNPWTKNNPVDEGPGIVTFPNKPGNEWKYYVMENQSSVVDTLIIRVREFEYNCNLTNVTVWDYFMIYQGSRDEIQLEPYLVCVVGDSVFKYNYSNTVFTGDSAYINTEYAELSYVFPLKVGNYWDYYIGNRLLYPYYEGIDTVFVDGITGSYADETGNYDVYHLSYHSEYPSSEYYFSVLFVPNIGEVYFSCSTYDRKTIYYQLFDYNIVQ